MLRRCDDNTDSTFDRKKFTKSHFHINLNWHQMDGKEALLLYLNVRISRTRLEDKVGKRRGSLPALIGSISNLTLTSKQPDLRVATLASP
jgi:hypothetical protein